MAKADPYLQISCEKCVENVNPTSHKRNWVTFKLKGWEEEGGFRQKFKILPIFVTRKYSICWMRYADFKRLTFCRKLKIPNIYAIYKENYTRKWKIKIQNIILIAQASIKLVFLSCCILLSCHNLSV